MTLKLLVFKTASHAFALDVKFIKEIKVRGIYFSICLSLLLTGINAQQAEKHKLTLKNNLLENPSLFRTNKLNSVNALSCDTISTLTTKDTLTLYSIVSTSSVTNGGYVTGNNGYADSALATFIPKDTLISNGAGQITGVMAVFYKYGTMGTKGSQVITVHVFAGDTLHGPATTTTIAGTNTVVATAPPIGTATASLSTISATTPTNNAVPLAVAPVLSSNYEVPCLFSFPSPVIAPDSGFFISLTLPTIVGDTAVLLCTRNDASKNNYAWSFGVHGWQAFSNSNNWALYTSLTLFPVICYQPAGIKQNILETNIAYFPNPNKGEFSFAIALPKATNLSISITNSIGQKVFNQTENNISHSVIHYDVSFLEKGIYFVTLTDSENNRVTKKMILE